MFSVTPLNIISLFFFYLASGICIPRLHLENTNREEPLRQKNGKRRAEHSAQDINRTDNENKILINIPCEIWRDANAIVVRSTFLR